MSAAIDRALEKLDAILASLSSPNSSGPPTVFPSASNASLASSTTTKSAPAAIAPAAAAGKADAATRDILVNKAQIKVALVLRAEKQTNSEKLLKLKVGLGGEETRQVMAGLQQFLSPEQLAGQLVCVAANLKPAKLAGEASEAMILAAEAAQPGGGVLVRPLLPPEGSQPGDLVHLDGTSPPSAYPKVLKLDEWRKVLPGLFVLGGVARFDGTPLVTSSGVVTLPPEIPDGSEIH